MLSGRCWIVIPPSPSQQEQWSVMKRFVLQKSHCMCHWKINFLLLLLQTPANCVWLATLISLGGGTWFPWLWITVEQTVFSRLCSCTPNEIGLSHQSVPTNAHRFCYYCETYKSSFEISPLWKCHNHNSHTLVTLVDKLYLAYRICVFLSLLLDAKESIQYCISENIN